MTGRYWGEVWDVLIRALRSPYSLSLIPIAITVPVSIASNPLIDGATQPQYIGQWLLASAIGQAPALLVLYIGWLVFFRNRSQIALLTLPLVTAAAGATKGLFTQTAAELLIPETFSPTEVIEKMIGSGISWSMGMTFLGTISYLILSSRSKMVKLKLAVLENQKQAIDLQRELDQLVKLQVNGLDQELSNAFLKLLRKLKQGNKGAEINYAQMIALISEFNRSRLRPTSKELWKEPTANLPLLEAAKLNFTRNPLPALLAVFIFSIGSFIVEIRNFGFGPGLAVSFGTATLMLSFILLMQRGSYAGVKRLVTPGLTALLAASSTLILQLLTTPERGETYLVLNFLINLLWAITTIFIAGWLTLAWQLFSNELENAQSRLNLSEQELAWLEMRLESSQREMAKHLHGLVQTRLLAHSINLQNKESTATQDEALRDVLQLLSSPMQGFSPPQGSLEDELTELARQWGDVIKVEFDVTKCDQQIEVVPTMQLIREALSNASKHGNAKNLRIMGRDIDQKRTIEIVDDGIGTPVGKRGLGSEIFDSITRRSWKLESTAVGTRLTAQIPLIPK